MLYLFSSLWYKSYRCFYFVVSFNLLFFFNMRLRRRLVQCSNIVHLSASESHGEHVAEEADVSEAAVRKAIQQDQSSAEADADSLLWSVQDQLCRTADLPRAPWWTEAQEERGGTEEQPAFVRSNVVQSAPLWALWRHVYWIGCIRCSHSRRKTSKGSDISYYLKRTKVFGPIFVCSSLSCIDIILNCHDVIELYFNALQS